MRFFYFLILFSTVLYSEKSSAQSHVTPKDSEDSVYQSRLKLDHFIQMLSNYYVDDVDFYKMAETMIFKGLKELDPHSVYIEEEKVEGTEETLKGGFFGIGIRFDIYKDTILVAKPLLGGPSAALGISTGDKIIKVDGENVAGIGISNSGVQKRLKGDKGTKVEVEIMRQGFDELIKYEIIRDKIPLYSIEGKYMVNDSVGYIRINDFAATTSKEFDQAIDSLKRNGCKHLILDLTGNAGGYLGAAINLVDNFVPRNKKILYTQGKRMPVRNFYSTFKGKFLDGKLVVMMDQSSASASEITAGALQDLDRAIIVGRRSFGKGLVQQPFTFLDGSKIRLTVSKYYIPSGRLIQKPYEKSKDKDNDAYHLDLNDRYESGEYFSEDSVKFLDSTEYFTENGRIVRGGGGIMPDYFVPMDTAQVSELWRKIRRNTSIYSFVLQYVTPKKEALVEKYQTFGDFLEDTKFQRKLLEKYLLFLKDEYNIEPENEEDLNKSKMLIKSYINGYFCSHLFTMSELYYIINQKNDIYKKAIEIINNGTSFEKLGIHY